MMYIQSLRLFFKNKVLWIALLAFTLFFLWDMGVFLYEGFGYEYDMLDYTKEIITFSPQILIFYLVISYEFSSEVHRVSMDETLQVTYHGARMRPLKAQGYALFTVLFVNFILFLVLDVLLTNLAFAHHNVSSFPCQGLLYIAECLFVNVFLIGLIGILSGLFLSKFKRRIIAYSVIIAVMFVTSYLLNDIADLIQVLSDFAINLHETLDIFNIMTPGLNFLTNTAFGFSLLAYRVCLILFWCFFLLILIYLTHSGKKNIFKLVACVLCCLLTFVGYVLPTSKVDMGLSSTSSSMVDQHYYNFGEYRIGNSENNFTVTKYNIKLKINRLLNAEVEIFPSKILAKYEFTLSHSYTVTSIYDNEGKPLEYSHDGDALLIKSSAKTTSFTVNYNGSNEAYYANSQGVNLRGSFPYYPVPGYHQITEDGLSMNAIFLNSPADFSVEIDSKVRIYSNLEETSNGHYAGLSHGPTFVGGLYTSYTKDNVTIVYPFFNGWNTENLDALIEASMKDNPNRPYIFITPNMNRVDDAVNEEQIITRNYFESLEDLD